MPHLWNKRVCPGLGGGGDDTLSQHSSSGHKVMRNQRLTGIVGTDGQVGAGSDTSFQEKDNK